MAFVVEDGSGLPNATAYADVSAVVDYWTDRGGNEKFDDAGTAVQRAAIVKATSYIERRFGPHFRGVPAVVGQALSWPRTGALSNAGVPYAGDSIPARLVFAVAEYAAAMLDADFLNPDPEAVANDAGAQALQQGGRVTSIREKVDVLETEITYAQDLGRSSARLGTVALASESSVPEYPAGDLWLEELVRNTQGGTNVARFGRLARA